MAKPGNNLDMLAWFNESERGPCAACGEQTCVGLDGDAARICLACGAVWLRGERIDRERRIDPDP